MKSSKAAAREKSMSVCRVSIRRREAIEQGSGGLERNYWKNQSSCGSNYRCSENQTGLFISAKLSPTYPLFDIKKGRRVINFKPREHCHVNTNTVQKLAATDCI